MRAIAVAMTFVVLAFGALSPLVVSERQASEPGNS